MTCNDMSTVEKINTVLMLTNQLTVQGNQNCALVATICTYLSQTMEELKLVDPETEEGKSTNE